MHDPMCIGIMEDWRGNQPCDCARVKKIRADEDLRIAKASGYNLKDALKRLDEYERNNSHVR